MVGGKLVLTLPSCRPAKFRKRRKSVSFNYYSGNEMAAERMAWGNLPLHHMRVINSQHLTDAAYSVEITQSTITISTDVSDIDQKILGAQKFSK